MLGKHPIVSVSQTGISVSHLMSVCAWSLAVAVAACFKHSIVADIDKAIIAAGYTMGPFEAIDRVQNSMLYHLFPVLLSVVCCANDV